MVTIRIPALPRGLGTNLLGLAGLVAFALAVGGLSGDWWWTVLVGGTFAVALAVLAQFNTSADAGERPAASVKRIGAA